MKKKKFNKEQLQKLDQESLVKIILSQQEEIQEMKTLFNTRTYGKSSEQNIHEGQINMFNEAEELYDENAVEPKVEEITYKRKKAKGKRKEDLKGLPVTIVEHTLSEEELKEEFPEGYDRFPDEVYNKLNYKPAVFEVIEHHVAVYKGKSGKIIRAPHAVEILEKSIATPSLAAEIMNAKYVNSVPLYRIEQDFSRHDINLSRQVMAGWMIKFAERYFSLLWDRFKALLLAHHVVHADETPVQVSKDGRKAGSKSYMWVYRSNENDENPIIMYDFRKTRNADHLKDFLGDFKGCIVSDGYAAYHKMAKERPNDIVVAGCWVHCRRRFADIVKSASGSDKKKAKYSLATYALEQIAQITHLDNKLKDCSAQERLKERKLTIAPRVKAFFAWAQEHLGEVTKGSNIGKALSYALTQKEYLCAFLEDGELPLTNNAAERAIRPFCIGKKNWVMIDSVNGAESSAIIYSIAETAKANKLKPFEYFKYLLEEIPKHMDDKNLDFLDELLPWSESLPEKCHQKKSE